MGITYVSLDYFCERFLDSLQQERQKINLQPAGVSWRKKKRREKVSRDRCEMRNQSL